MANKKIRLNLDITPKVKEQIESLQEKCDDISMVELIRKALSVYEILLDHKRGCGEIVLRNNKEGSEKLVLIV